MSPPYQCVPRARRYIVRYYIRSHTRQRRLYVAKGSYIQTSTLRPPHRRRATTRASTRDGDGRRGTGWCFDPRPPSPGWHTVEGLRIAWGELGAVRRGIEGASPAREAVWRGVVGVATTPRTRIGLA
eukprot:2312477-Pleurochrysis_carterae.AAC.1